MTENPLVSVIISTFNAGEMLVNHSLRSVLEQTYHNLEIIVIDDGSIDDTKIRMLDVIGKDERVIYRQKSPSNNTNWYSTGTEGMNLGLSLATGDYIAHLDDDDFFLPEKIETLINFNKNVDADIIHHPFLIHYAQFETYKRIYMESLECTFGNITTSTLFYKGKYKTIPFGGPELEIPGDWDKAQNILKAGGIPARCPEMLVLKNGYRECTTELNLPGSRNRLYRPKWEPGPYKNIKNEGK